MMTLDQNYIGIDIGKTRLDLFDERSGRGTQLANRPAELAHWAAGLEAESLVVLEATGHYDRSLRDALDRAGIGYIRVNPLRARDFARSLGQLAKTDQLDARMLSRMGRSLQLTPQPAMPESRRHLAELGRRRDQLVAIRAREANHAEAASDLMRRDIDDHIGWLDQQIAAIDRRIEQFVARTAELAEANRLLRSAPGVGPVTATSLLALLPELGQRTDKAIAALGGLAPLNRDSGSLRGTRHIGPGRGRVRRALYMAALNAIRCCARFKAAYLALRQRGKPTKLAIIAIARKLLVVLNAMLRDQKPFAQ